MSNIQDFLLQNVKQVEDTKEVKFDRFKSPFVIGTITEAENTALKRSVTVKRIARSGNKVADTDWDKYMDVLVVNCVKEPNLASSELQASYGTDGSKIDTLKAMLRVGEYTKLAKEVQEFNGFESDDDVEELAEDVKN